MANRLKMAEINAIHTLHQSGYSGRKIAELLDVHRDTVAKYVAELQNRSNAPTGSDDQKEASDSTIRPGPQSECEPFRDLIVTKLERGLSAQRIHQDLVTDHGFTAQYHSVRRFVARMLGTRELPVRRMEVLPAKKHRSTSVRPPRSKRLTARGGGRGSSASYSRIPARRTAKQSGTRAAKLHRRAGERLSPLRRRAENAGDRQPQGGRQRGDWYDPEVHPKLQSFAQHYGTVFLPTKPYTPQHKGKVEAGVKYVKNNALKSRTFQQPGRAERVPAWIGKHERRRHANPRHDQTVKSNKRFDQSRTRDCVVAASARIAFRSFTKARRAVHRDGHIEVDKAFYSVPPEYVTPAVVGPLG